MSERRSTRSSTQKQTEDLTNKMLEREEKAKASAIKRQSMAESRRLAKEQNLLKLKNFFKLKLSKDEKDKFTKDFTQQYMWEYELWRDYLLNRIENDDLESVLFYLEKITNCSSIRTNIQYNIDDMEFMIELLDKMRDMKREYIFWDRPYWIKLKKCINPDTEWWLKHIYNSFEDSYYIKKLLEHSWKMISWKLLINVPFMSRKTIAIIINHIYEKDDLIEYRFNGNKHQLNILLYLTDVMTETQKENVRYYLNYLIIKRQKSLPPLTVDITQTVHGDPTYVFDIGLYQFIIKCLEMNETSILENFIKVFDIKRIENDSWFRFLLECIIKPEFVKKYGYISTSIKINDIKKLVSFIIKGYKININNVYMNQKDLFKGEQPNDPIRNPKIWLDKNIPVIAFAVLHKNKDAIDYLLEHGAKLDRCVIAMQDLTDDPAILGRFDRERKATKIQRAYSEHLYSPSHISHKERIESYKEKYQKEKPSPIEEEISGGKKKINKNKK
jgi:hypothetical protein